MPKTLNESMLGQRIKEIRPMTQAEMAAEDWHGTPPTLIILENGTKIYPSRDPEGNGPGMLFGQEADGTTFYVHVQK